MVWPRQYAFMNWGNNCTPSSLCKRKQLVPEVCNWCDCTALFLGFVLFTRPASVLHLDEEAPYNSPAVEAFLGAETAGFFPEAR